MANIIYQKIMTFAFERNTSKRSFQDYEQRLRSAGENIVQKIDNAADTAKSRWHLTHIIGMEQWMQGRIKVGLGEPLVDEEYDKYRPALDTPWNDLKQVFLITRQTSCDLCDKLAQENADGAQKVVHKDFGEMSIKAWLEYVQTHGNGHALMMSKAKNRI